MNNTKFIKWALSIIALTFNASAYAQIASGTSGTCTWVISEDSVLTISPENGTNGVLKSSKEYWSVPWYKYVGKVKKVIIKSGVAANTKAGCLFYGMKNCISMDIANLDVSNATTLNGAFCNCSSITTLDISKWDVSNVTNFYETFCHCSSLTSLDVSEWDMSKVTSLKGTFYCCSSLTSLDVSKWNVSNVKTLWNTFYICPSLTSLDVSRWNTSNVTNMSNTFSSCRSLTSLDVSKWDVSNVTTLEYTFHDCKSLTSLDVSKWDVSNVTTLKGTFCDCPFLTSLDVSKWDVSKDTTLYRTFSGCSALTSLDLSTWNVSKVTNLGLIFYNCKSMVYINIGGWDMSNSTNSGGIFTGCNALETLVTPETVSSYDVKLPYSMYDWDDDNAEYTILPGGTLTIHKTKCGIDVTIGKSGYATFYYSNHNFELPEGVTATTYYVEGDELKTGTSYESGSVIPAGTGVVLSDGDTENANTYTFYYTKTKGTAPTSNMLYGSDEETLTVAPADGDYYFYQLSLNSKEEEGSIGFYWGAKDGAAFTNGAHKAYLAVPQSSGAKGWSLSGSATGISNIKSETQSENAIYDLKGRCVGNDASTLQRGIYIVNGKKIVIK